MPLLDFNSLVICNDFYSNDELKEALSFFQSIGIRKFIVLKNIDPALDSTFSINNQMKNLNAKIKANKPRGALVRSCANIYLSPKVMQHPILKDLTLGDTDIVFIQPPLFVTDSWLQPDLNYLLYKQKLKPSFSCFERTYMSCKQNVTQGLLKIKSASFCLDIDLICSKDHEDFITYCMRENKIILPSISRDIRSYYPIISRFQYMRERMGNKKYLLFCRYINQSLSTIFRQL